MRLQRLAVILAGAVALLSPMSAHAACFVTKTVGPDCANINACVAAIGASISGNYCIDIVDSNTYGELGGVTVSGIATNGFRIIIGPQSAVNHPTVTLLSNNASGGVFTINNASVTIQNLTVTPGPTNLSAYGIVSNAGSTSISNVFVSTGASSNPTIAGIALSTGNTLSNSTVAVTGMYALVVGGQNVRVIQSSFTNSSSNETVLFSGAQASTATQIFAQNAGAGSAIGLLAGANFNVVSFSTMISNGFPADAMHILASSGNLVTQSFMTATQGNAAAVYSGAYGNTISASTMTAGNSGSSGLFLGGLANTVTGSVMTNVSGYGLTISGGILDAVTLSSMSVAAGGGDALYVTSSSSNTIAASAIVVNAGGAAAALVDAASTFNAFNGCSVYGIGSGVVLNGPTGTTISQSFVQMTGGGAAMTVQSGAVGSVVLQSTITNVASQPAITVYHASATTISGSYVGSMNAGAITVNGSTGTTVVGSTLLAPGGIAAAWFNTGSVGVNLTSNTVVTGAANGFRIDAYTSGPIQIATNTVPIHSAGFAVSIGTLASPSPVWITSNTFLPTIDVGSSMSVLQFNGLATGATVQFNSMYFRGAFGAAGVNFNGLYAISSPGLTIHHNRINDNGSVTAGNFAAAQLVGSPNVGFKYNDVNVAGSAFTSAYLLEILSGSTGVQVMDNAFAASVSVTGSSATMLVDGASASGFTADFNDYFSSNSFNTIVCGGTAFTPGQAYTCGGTLVDAHSIASNPLWASVALGSEDFHPLSQAGRWNGAGFVADAATSLTIDSGDPNDPPGPEPGGNPRANQGSYGLTAQASIPPAPAAVSGCVLANHVGAGAPYATINAALAALPNPYSANECVVIDDAATYVEQVSLVNVALGTSTLTIMANPLNGAAPTVSPPAGALAAFVVQSASVNIKGLAVRPNAAMAATSYGILVSSPNVTISSVAVIDTLGRIQTNGILLASADTVTGSTVSVTAAIVHALSIPSGTRNVVSASTLTAAGTSGHGFFVGGASNTVTGSYLAGLGGGYGAYLAGGGNAINSSTIAATGGGKGAYVAGSTNAFVSDWINSSTSYGALFDVGATSCTVAQSTVSNGNNATSALTVYGSSNAITRSVITSPGAALVFDGTFGGGAFNAVSFSSVSTAGAGNVALYFQAGASSNSATNSFFLAGGTSYGVIMISGAASNSVSLSTIAASSNKGVFFDNASSNTVAQCSISDQSDTAVWFQNGSKGNAIVGSTVTDAGGFASVYLINASSNAITRSIISHQNGNALYFDQGSVGNTLSFSTVTTLVVGALAAVTFNTGSSAASSNTVTQSYVYAPTGSGARFNSANSNTIAQSQIYVNGGFAAVWFIGGSSNTLTQDFIANGAGAYAVQLDPSSNGNAVDQSTVTGNFQAAVMIAGSSATAITNSYVQSGSTAVWIGGSTNTYMNADVIVGGGNGVGVVRGSAGLRLTQTVFSPPASGSYLVAVYVGDTSGGVFDISTNTIQSGPYYGVYVSTLPPGSTLWIASNTVTFPINGLDPGPGASAGIFLNGGISGAGIHNNSVYSRGAATSAGTRYGILVLGAAGAAVDHNRINYAGSSMAGNVLVPAALTYSPNAAFKFNDVSVNGGANPQSLTMLRIIGSAGVTVADDVFSQSITVSAPPLIMISLDSLSSLNSNYNDFYNASGALTALCNGATISMLPSWSCGGSLDAFSIKSNPLWMNTASGSEDFHPLSMGGRWNGASFVADAASALTIDAGDPNEPYNLEASPNGARVNQGSYGDTPEASLTPPDVCPLTRDVCKTGNCHNVSIQEAINSLPRTLPSYSCVVIRDNSTYAENPDIEGFTMNGSSLTVSVGPGSSPLLQPVASPTNAGFTLRNASVTLAGLTISPAAGLQYGVYVGSQNVMISSVSVLDPSGFVNLAGLYTLGGTTIAYTTVNVRTAHGVVASLGNNTIMFSSVTQVATVAGYLGIWLNGGPNDVVDHTVVSAQGSNAALNLESLTNSTVSFSTITCPAASSHALEVQGSGSNNYIRQSYIYNASGVGAFVIAGNNLISASTIAAPGGLAVNLGGINNSLSNVSISGQAGVAETGILNTVSNSTITATAGYGVTFLNGGSASDGHNDNVVTRSVINSLAGDGVDFTAGANGNALSYSSVTSAGPNYALLMNGVSSNTVSNSWFFSGTAASLSAALLTNASSNTISGSTLTTNTGPYALYLANSSSNVFTQDLVTNQASSGTYMDAASRNNSILGSTLAAPGLGAFSQALYLIGASSNLVSGSVITGGAVLDASAANNTVALSTITGLGGGSYALSVLTASTNTVSQSYLANLTGPVLTLGGSGACSQNAFVNDLIVSSGTAANGVFVNGASTNVFFGDVMTSAFADALFLQFATSNTIVLSTMTTGSGTALAIDIFSSSNAVTQSYIANTGVGFGAVVQSRAVNNRFAQDTFYSNQWEALVVNGADKNAVSQSYLVSASTALTVQNSSFTSISASTMIATGVPFPGLWVRSSSATAVAGSYIQGSTGAFVSGSTWTSIGGSVLAAGPGGSAVLFAPGDFGITVSSNVVYGGQYGAGIYVGGPNAGPVFLSTNVVAAGPQVGINVQAGAPVYITSNTIVPSVTSQLATAGIFLANLASGATVQNNGVYFRSSGAGPTWPNAAFGLYVTASGGVRIDHNRVSNPGAVTSGQFIGAFIVGSPGTMFKFNDMYGAGVSLSTPTELYLFNSSASVVTNNVFFNNMTPSSFYSMAMYVDVVSEPGLVSDYNDFFIGPGAGAFIGGWGSVPGPHPTTLAGWRSTSGVDAHSITGDPLWPSTTNGSEDFHPKSATGRFDPATQAFTAIDSTSSPTIDAGDPAESFSMEPNPNGLRVNQGSYGGTPQASKTPPIPGCASQVTVGGAGTGADYPSIGLAVAGLGGSLGSDKCIIIIDNASSWFEQVGVSGLTTNNHRLTFMSHPNLIPRAVIDPNGNTAAFLIQNDSVTVYNLDIRPTGPAGSVSYGVYGGGAAIRVSSVNVVDPGGRIAAAGILASSAAAISWSSVTVQNAAGLVLVGAGATVSLSSATNAFASSAALFLNGASSSTISQFFAQNSNGTAVLLAAGANSNSIAQSTMTGGLGTTLIFSSATSNSVTGSVIANPAGGGALFSASNFNSIAASTVAITSSGPAAVRVSGSSGTALTQDLLTANGDGVLLDAGANAGTISGSTIAVNVGGTGAALHMIGASSNVVAGSVLSNANGVGAALQSASNGNVIQLSTISAGNGWGTVAVSTSVADQFVQDYFPYSFASAAVIVSVQPGSDFTRISQSTMSGAGAGVIGLALASVGDVVSQSVIQVGGNGVNLAGGANGGLLTSSFVQGANGLTGTSNANFSVVGSTVLAATGVGIQFNQGAGMTIAGCYVAGSTGVYVVGSTGTIVDASVLVASSPFGMGLTLAGGSNGLSASSNTFYGGAVAAGVYLDDYNTGSIVLSTNVFAPVSVIGVYAGTQTAATGLWITSNTVSVMLSSSKYTYGLYFNGLASGATIENNALVHRSPSATANSKLLYAQSSSGLVVDHNRFSDPGMTLSGSFYAAYLTNATNTSFKFNDVHSTAPAGVATALLRAGESSSGLVLRDNVFSSSFTAPGVGFTSATVIVADAATETGFSGDYNDYFSSNGVLGFQWNAGGFATLAGWQTATAQETRSISVNPRWADPRAGVEDFHPLSQAGRVLPGGGLTSDAWTAGTIDQADPAEPFVGEAFAANGGRANLGSYGDTSDASRTPAAPTGLAVANVYVSSVAVSFNSGGANSYAVAASPNAAMTPVFASSASSSQTTLAPQGLGANTTYYLTVTAQWGELAVVSTTTLAAATLAAPPAANATTFSAVATSSASVLWLPNGNPLSVTTYTVVMTTGAAYPNSFAGNVSIATTPAANPPSATFAGTLAPNTTYFAFAAAVNWAGLPSPYTLLGSTATVPAAPAAAAVSFVAVTSWTVGVAWSPNGNPLSITTYTVQVSTDPTFTNVGASSATLSTAPAGAPPSATLLGLLPNATYYLRVQTAGSDGVTTAFVNMGSSSTLAAAPVLAAFAVPSAGLIQPSWIALGNPPGTLYVLQTSSVAAFTGAVTSSFTYNLFASSAGLATNTTYYFQAAAVDNAGVATPFVSFGGVATLANSPAPTGGAAFFGVGSSSFSAQWSANGNPTGTSYFITASTASDFNAYASSVSFTTAPAGGAPSATFTGLNPFTTYYVDVAAVNRNGVVTSVSVLGSTTTLPPSLFPPVLQSLSVFTTSATAVWTLVPSATGYTLIASTMPANPPTAVWASSAPAGLTATTATVTGLQPDTTYFLFVQADGVNAASQFSAYAATSTFPAAPSSSSFSAVAFTSFTVSWSANGNPLAMTTYTVVASTDPAFGVGASSVSFSTVPAAGPSAGFAGLAANTTYYFEVRALGNGGFATPFVALGSTTTPVAPPAVLAPSLVFSSANALVAAWGANANPLAITTYVVVASTASDFNAFASSVVVTTAPAAGPSAYLSGLGVNTTYYVGARGLGVGGSSSTFVVFGATSTAAVPPGAAAFSGVTVAAIQANWTAGLDPAGTLYQLQVSPSAGFAGTVTSSFTYNVSASTAGLVPNTTYFFQVLALNNDGAATPFVGLGSTSTLAAAPSPAAVSISSVFSTSVTLNWLANGDPLGFTTYTIVASTASDFNQYASSVVFTTAPAAGPSATMTGLAFGTSYYFEVRAVSNGGIPTAYASLGSTYTVLSSLFPQISNFQTGDAQWRRANNGVYDVRFQDGSGAHLNKFQVKASTTPGGVGTDLVAYTDVAVNLSPADSYATPWSLPAAVYNALLEGVTNYITVRVFNNVPNATVLQDAFFVLKDTTPPTLVNAQAGDNAVRSAPGTTYAVSALDTGSGLAAFQYSASTNTSGDASLIGWTNIAALSGTTSYATPWPVNFAGLRSGVTNYISVRAWDVAGATTTLNNAFYVLKDTVGPTVSISSPSVATGYVAPFGGVVAGAAVGAYPVQGDEVAVLLTGSSLYWNPGAGLFNSATPVWMPAVGQSAWTFNLAANGISFADGTAYKIVARSSTTFNVYSITYATAAFVFDASTPTVGVQAPVPNSTVSSLPVISGTAADPGASASGVASVEVRLQRFSDGLWWNWFTQAWGGLAVSTVATGTTAWSVTPTPQLQANLLSGASYFVAVRASDNAAPPNQGNFVAQGATFTFSNPTPPSPVADLAAYSGSLPGQIALSWHATGENGGAGIVLSGQYAVFYATYSAATPSTAAAQVLFSTGNVAPGQPSSYTVTGLTAGVTYFLEIALRNTDGNWSAFSNQASTVATPAPLNAILGHVVDVSTRGITGVEVDAWNSAGALVSTAFTLADGSGTYSVGGLAPGTYKLQATWTVNGVTSSVWQDNISMGTVGVDFSLGINYSLATLTGSLASLTTSAARTATTPQALLRPQGGAGSSFIEVVQRGRTITSVGVPPSGRWTVPSLLPGQYSVRAFTGASYTDYQDITLAEGETRQVIFAFNALPDDSVFAYPNPAKDSTTFRFLTPYNSFEAVIDVFDVAGRLVREIPGSAIAAAPASGPGVYHYVWDLTNSRGQAVASGVYLFYVKIKGSDGTVVKVVKKLAVVR